LEISEVREKKDWKVFSVIPKPVSVVLLLLSFSFQSAYKTQTLLFLMPSFYDTFGLRMTVDTGFAVVAYIAGGLLSFLVFELLIRMFKRMLSGAFAAERMRYGQTSLVPDASGVPHLMRTFMIPLNLVLGLVHLLYFYFPFFISFSNVVLDFLLIAGWGVLFFVYYKRKLPPHLYGRTFMLLASLVLAFFGVLSAITLVGALV
jgi:hypothetical protein